MQSPERLVFQFPSAQAQTYFRIFSWKHWLPGFPSVPEVRYQYLNSLITSGYFSDQRGILANASPFRADPGMWYASPWWYSDTPRGRKSLGTGLWDMWGYWKWEGGQQVLLQMSHGLLSNAYAITLMYRSKQIMKAFISIWEWRLEMNLKWWEILFKLLPNSWKYCLSLCIVSSSLDLQIMASLGPSWFP